MNLNYSLFFLSIMFFLIPTADSLSQVTEKANEDEEISKIRLKASVVLDEYQEKTFKDQYDEKSDLEYFKQIKLDLVNMDDLQIKNLFYSSYKKNNLEGSVLLWIEAHLKKRNSNPKQNDTNVPVPTSAPILMRGGPSMLKGPPNMPNASKPSSQDKKM